MKPTAIILSVALLGSLTLSGNVSAQSGKSELAATTGGMAEKVGGKSAKSPLSTESSVIPPFGTTISQPTKSADSNTRFGGYSTAAPTSGIPKKAKIPSAEDEEEIRKMLMVATRLEKLMKDAEEWERKQPSDSGKGSLKRVYERAENFAIERQTRKKLETDVKALISTLHAFVTKRQDALRRAELANELAKKVASEQKNRVQTLQPHGDGQFEFEMSAPEDENVVRPDNFEIHEVEKPMTLKEISALPSVYNDANKWQMLYNANQGKIPDPNAKIPMGQGLIVPRPKPPRDFIREFSNE